MTATTVLKWGLNHRLEIWIEKVKSHHLSSPLLGARGLLHHFGECEIVTYSSNLIKPIRFLFCLFFYLERPIYGYGAVYQLHLSLEFDEGPNIEVINSWQEMFPLPDGSLQFFTLCFGLFHNLLDDLLMCFRSNFGRPATSDRVHHWSQFFTTCG